MFELGVLDIVSVRRTVGHSLIKILPGVMGTKFKAQTRDLQLLPRPVVSIVELWVLPQFNESPSRVERDMEQTRNSTCDL